MIGGSWLSVFLFCPPPRKCLLDLWCCSVLLCIIVLYKYRPYMLVVCVQVSFAGSIQKKIENDRVTKKHEMILFEMQ